MKNYFHKSGFWWFGGGKGASETLRHVRHTTSRVCLCARGTRQPTCARVLTFHFFALTSVRGKGVVTANRMLKSCSRLGAPAHRKSKKTQRLIVAFLNIKLSPLQRRPFRQKRSWRAESLIKFFFFFCRRASRPNCGIKNLRNPPLTLHTRFQIFVFHPRFQ